MPPISAKYLLLLPLLLALACNRTAPASEKNPEAPKGDSIASTPSRTLETQDDSLIPKGATSRFARPDSFDFAKALPRLSQLVETNPAFSAQLAGYAEAVITGKQIASEEDLLNLVRQRKNEIIPALGPYFTRMDPESFYVHAESLIQELQQIGIGVATIEGMYGALVPADIPNPQLAKLGSEALHLYLDFLSAEGAAVGGEYPYSDMEPYRKMVLTGEKIMDKFPQSEYFGEIEPRFRKALLTFTGIFLQRQGTYTLPMVGNPLDVSEFGMTETETHKAFVQEDSESRYAVVVKNMIEQLSVAGSRPENLYLIFVDWAKSEEEARKKQYRYLDAGKDILHCLKVQRGDGTEQYALVLRFFDDDQIANPYFEKAASTWENLQMMMVSVSKNKLYQLGI